MRKSDVFFAFMGICLALLAGAWVHSRLAMDSALESIEHSAEMGLVLHQMLTDLGESHPSVGEVRSIGLFGVIEVVCDRSTKEPMAPYNGSSPEMTALRKYLLDKGVYLYTHWHTILIIPPLIITAEQLQEGFAVLDKALEITDSAIR